MCNVPQIQLNVVPKKNKNDFQFKCSVYSHIQTRVVFIQKASYVFSSVCHIFLLPAALHAHSVWTFACIMTLGFPAAVV